MGQRTGIASAFLLALALAALPGGADASPIIVPQPPAPPQVQVPTPASSAGGASPAQAPAPVSPAASPAGGQSSGTSGTSSPAASGPPAQSGSGAPSGTSQQDAPDTDVNNRFPALFTGDCTTDLSCLAHYRRLYQNPLPFVITQEEIEQRRITLSAIRSLEKVEVEEEIRAVVENARAFLKSVLPTKKVITSESEPAEEQVAEGEDQSDGQVAEGGDHGSSGELSDQACGSNWADLNGGGGPVALC